MKILLCAGTNGRAVVIGECKGRPVAGKPVTLQNARIVLYWDKACGGLLGLAANGPKGETRITATVPELVVTVWQEWMAVTDEAAEELDSGRWACIGYTVEGHRSVGHLEVAGRYEFYEQAGEVYRAPLSNAFDGEGRRHGRWECSLAHFRRNRAYIFPPPGVETQV